MHLGKVFSLKSFSLILASDYTQKGKMKVGFIQKVKARDNKKESTPTSFRHKVPAATQQ